MLTASPKQDYVTILAIYDDPPTPTQIEANFNRSDSKISISVNGCQESRVNSSKSAFNKLSTKDDQKKSISILRNSSGKPGRETHSVHFSSQPPLLPTTTALYSTQQNLKRENIRKSRITDSLMECKESIENEMKQKWSGFDPSIYKLQRIVLSPEGQDLNFGLEISAVPDHSHPNILLAVEVRAIEEKGRIAVDGRLRVGDQIVEINGIPIAKVSLARARLHLRELQTVAEPNLTFFRRTIQTKSKQNSLKITPILSALQQGNTSQIGQTKTIYLVKEDGGFGFTYAGRESFSNEQKEFLYYVKSVRERCREQGLAVGDRMLEIDGQSLATLVQAQVTALLKQKSVGDRVALLISRNTETGAKECEKVPNTKDSNKPTACPQEQIWRELKAQFDAKSDLELICLDIPLNDTPGAGLGVSLKAQRVGTTDAGLYVRSILHGSAAFKDGRLRVDDRLVGVEDRNLLQCQLNGEALESFMRVISQMPQWKKTIRLFIVRKLPATGLYSPSSSMCNARRGSDSDLSQISTAITFERETNARRSISEKRINKSSRDPSRLRTYQRIVHQRQISAPILPPTQNRSRRSLYDSGTIRPDGDSSPKETKAKRHQRPNTVFYVDDEKQKCVVEAVDFARKKPPNRLSDFFGGLRKEKEGANEKQQVLTPSTLPRSCTSPSRYLDDTTGQIQQPQIRDSSQKNSLPSSISQPTSLASVGREEDKNGNAIDGVEPKQSKPRRASLGNGLLKLFGKGRESNGGDSAAKGRAEDYSSRDQYPPQPFVRPDHRPPPPPYRPQMAHSSFYPANPNSHSLSCTNLGQVAASTSTNQFVQTRRTFVGAPSPPSAISGHSPPFRSGQDGVHHWREGGFDSPAPPPHQFAHIPRQKHPAQRHLESAITTHSIRGSLPVVDQRVFSADFSQQQPQWQSLPRKRQQRKGKPNPSAVFYDYGADWVVRC